MTVTLLDLRRRGAEAPGPLEGRILVVDESDSLLKHADIYQDLIGRPTIGGLICVAVGDAGADALADGVALTVPVPLRPDGEGRSAVLWAGDPVGLDWAPHASPTFPGPDAPDLDSLIAVLQVTEVFDAVLTRTAALPGAVGAPALRVAYGPVRTADLGAAANAAAQSLCRPGEEISRSLAADVRRLGAEHDPITPQLQPPVATRAQAAQRALTRATETVRALGTGWALFGSQRPTATVGTALRAAARAAESHQAGLDRLFNDMDSHLEEGRPPMADVIAHGLAEPGVARTDLIMDGLRHLVDERLTQGVPLPDLANELQEASAFSAPQGVTTQHDRVRKLTVPAGDLPRFPRWPLSLWTLPLIVVTCAATVLLAGPGPDGLLMGSLLGLAWTVAGWLLLARRPDAQGERGFGPSAPAALGTYGVAAAVGVTGGWALSRALTDPPEVPYSMVIFGLLVLLVAVVAIRGWRSAARRWSAALPLAGLEAAVAVLDDSTARACVTEWQPMRRRRAVAAAAGAASTGVDILRQTLDDAGDLLPSPAHRSVDGSPVAAPPELFQVIRGDLVGLCRTALDPVWSAVGAPHGSTDADVRQEFGRLLTRYREHVVRNGPISPFGPDADRSTRDGLMMRVWTGPGSAKPVLTCRASDPMTQLCGTHQLAFLSNGAVPELVRFAPQALLNVLRGDPTDKRIADDPHVVWTRGSEFIGVLRLLPLRAESIRWGWDGGLL